MRLDAPTFTPAIVVSAIAAVILPAAAEDAADGWRPMIYYDFRTPSPTDPVQTLVWPDAIREANAYATTELKQELGDRNAYLTALAATYREGDRAIIVSTALTRACDSGANDKGAGIEPSICPVRIATIVDGKLAALKTVTGCYADHADPDLPAKNRDDITLARFDAAAGTVSLRTRVGGRYVSACAHTYPIR